MLTVMLTMSDTKLMQFVVEALNHFGCSVLLMILLIQVTIYKIWFYLIRYLVDLTMEKWRICSNLIDGHEDSSCLPPCKRTTFKTLFMEKVQPQHDKPYLSITVLEKYVYIYHDNDKTFTLHHFWSSVHVTKHVLVRTNFNTLMSFVGANMGFWLGVGALQILKSIIDFARDKLWPQSQM